MLNPFRRAPRMLAPVARIYGRRLDQCGTTAQGVFWKNDHWHQKRFDRLIQIFSPEDAAHGRVVINDFGCGYGAFFDYLTDKPVLNGSQFFGYDITQEMIAACRDRIADPRATFFRKMIVTEVGDYTFASGTYNMNGNAEDDPWRDYVFESLAQIWSKTRKGLAFNMLRADERTKYDGLFYIDPEEMRRFCEFNLSADVEVFDENPMPDVSFLVRRP